MVTILPAVIAEKKFSIEFPLKSKQIRDSRSSGKKKIKKCSEISEQIGTI